MHFNTKPPGVRLSGRLKADSLCLCTKLLNHTIKSGFIMNTPTNGVWQVFGFDAKNWSNPHH